MDGILPVWKPVGITSYDVIRRWKKTYGRQYKIGHAGTLDPFADGVMLLMVGRGTKQFAHLQTLPKTYLATARLGASSDTLDITGTITTQPMTVILTLREAAEATRQFVGVIQQKIPDFSAAKVGGQPRYKLAREGIALPPKSKQVTCFSIDVVSLGETECVIRIRCSSGTYIRQLSVDIFLSLGVSSYLSQLTRLSVGTIDQDVCITLDQLALPDMVERRVLPDVGGFENPDA